jgi:WD40 repeat protein
MAARGIAAAFALWALGGCDDARANDPGHTGPVFALAFSPDVRTLASASADKTIRWWEGTHPLSTPRATDRARRSQPGGVQLGRAHAGFWR